MGNKPKKNQTPMLWGIIGVLVLALVVVVAIGTKGFSQSLSIANVGSEDRTVIIKGDSSVGCSLTPDVTINTFDQFQKGTSVTPTILYSIC